MVINSSTHPDVGFLGLKGCENITIEGLTLCENSHGVILEECVNCTVRNCVLQQNLVGAFVDAEQTSIVDSQILDNFHGILMTGNGNTLENNDVANNTIRSLPYWFPDEWPPIELRRFGSWILDLMWYSGGIYLAFADNCTLTDNRIMFNEHGVLLIGCSFSIFEITAWLLTRSTLGSTRKI
jgi:parallel beta-helix repeat protein